MAYVDDNPNPFKFDGQCWVRWSKPGSTSPTSPLVRCGLRIDPLCWQLSKLRDIQVSELSSIFWALTCVLVSVAILVAVLRLWRRSSNPGEVLTVLVFFTAIYKVVLFYLFPAGYRLVAGWDMDLVEQVLPSEVGEVYLLEGISYACWMLGFAWVGTRLAPAPAANTYVPARSLVSSVLQDSSRLLESERESGLALLLFLCGGYLFLLFRSLSSGLDMTNSTVSGYLWPIQPVAMWSGPICGLFLAAIGPRRAGVPAFLVGVVTSGAALWLAIGTGVRGALTGPAIWLLFLFVFVHRNRLLLTVAGLLLLSVAVFHDSMASQRSSLGVETLNTRERLALVLQDKQGQRDETGAEQSLVAAAAWRFGEESRLSTAFLRMRARGDLQAGHLSLRHSTHLCHGSSFRTSPSPEAWMAPV